MLEWKARIFTLLIAVLMILDQIGVQLNENWNW
jgi:hypothetical protein